MPLPRDPGPQRPNVRDLDRELARASSARRLLPWALLSAIGGGAIAYVAGGGLRGGATLAVVGLLFVVFLWTTSVVRCPACGARLPRGSREGPRGGPRAAPRPESCPGCGARF